MISALCIAVNSTAMPRFSIGGGCRGLYIKMAHGFGTSYTHFLVNISPRRYNEILAMLKFDLPTIEKMRKDTIKNRVTELTGAKLHRTVTNYIYQKGKEGMPFEELVSLYKDMTGMISHATNNEWGANFYFVKGGDFLARGVLQPIALVIRKSDRKMFKGIVKKTFIGKNYSPNYGDLKVFYPINPN